MSHQGKCHGHPEILFTLRKPEMSLPSQMQERGRIRTTFSNSPTSWVRSSSSNSPLSADNESLGKTSGYSSTYSTLNETITSGISRVSARGVECQSDDPYAHLLRLEARLVRQRCGFPFPTILCMSLSFGWEKYRREKRRTREFGRVDRFEDLRLMRRRV